MKTAAVILIACFAGTAAGEPLRDDDEPVEQPMRVPLTLLEQLSVLVPPMAYYWSSTHEQAVDFDMDWNWPSWRRKLTSPDAFILDTNVWAANAMRHPLAGYMDYEIGRTNGFSPIASVGMSLGAGIIWEYLVEYKELISLNDLVVNTATAFSMGEPLFQLGRLADERRAGWARHGLGLAASPYHRVHAWSGYSTWRARGPRWAQLEASAGAGVETSDGADRATGRIALDLELVTDRRYGRAGEDVARFGAGSWNRVVADVRAAPDTVTTVRLATQTTYAGRYTRSFDDNGNGTDWFIGTMTGADYLSQRLAHEWDSMFVMHLIGPRVAAARWRDGRRIAWELVCYADIGMIDAHVFGPRSPFPPLPLQNVLQAQGYYYATGLSAETRVRADLPGWTLQLEARAFQLWSIDGLDRVEMDGGARDPHDVTDQRVFGRASIGTRLDRDLRLELAVEAALRRGAWQARERITTELDANAGIVMPF